MLEKRFVIHPPKKFEMRNVSYPDTALISSVEPIGQGGMNTTNKEELEALVEAPLLDACKILHEKGIETVFSSANKKDVPGYAYIDINSECLSERNKNIALKIGEAVKIHGSVIKDGVRIKTPLTQRSTVGEIKQKFVNMVQDFEQQ